MVTYGDEPYRTMSPQEVVVAVQSGHRLEAPLNCPDFLREIMLSCWAEEPAQRPTWTAILDRICDLTEDDVLALRIANPVSASKQIEATLDRGRALRRASRVPTIDSFESCDSGDSGDSEISTTILSSSSSSSNSESSVDANVVRAVPSVVPAAVAPRVAMTLAADSNNYIVAAPVASTVIAGAVPSAVKTATAAPQAVAPAAGDNYITVEAAAPAAAPTSPVPKKPVKSMMAQTVALPGVASSTARTSSSSSPPRQILSSTRASSTQILNSIRSVPTQAPAQRRMAGAFSSTIDAVPYSSDEDSDDSDDERVVPKDSAALSGAGSVSMQSHGRKTYYSGRLQATGDSSDSSDDAMRYTTSEPPAAFTVSAILGDRRATNTTPPPLLAPNKRSASSQRTQSVGMSSEMRFDLSTRPMNLSGGKSKAISADDEDDNDNDKEEDELDADDPDAELVVPRRDFKPGKSFSLTGVLGK
jgi:hypothetical protein